MGGIYYNIIGNGQVEVTKGGYYPGYLDSVVIPSSVTHNYTTYSVIAIGDDAFSDDDFLTSVVIPNSVTSIGDGAFAGCSNIMDITCYAPVPPIIKQSTFANYDAALYVPANCVDIYSSTKYWEDFFIRAIQEDDLEYNLADRNVIYVNGKIYNWNSLDIKLFDASGRLISSCNGDIEMLSYPNGIYIQAL